jgi:hypothetical protein
MSGTINVEENIARKTMYDSRNFDSQVSKRYDFGLDKYGKTGCSNVCEQYEMWTRDPVKE